LLFKKDKAMDLQHAFEILEIDESASLSEIKQAYRDLALIWHPDHYTQNTSLHQKALGRMKELNAAYDCIRSYLLSKDKAGIYTGPAVSGYDEQIILICPNCGTKTALGHIPKS
jgi:preprotein translocase subunit Sec63